MLMFFRKKDIKTSKANSEKKDKKDAEIGEENCRKVRNLKTIYKKIENVISNV